MNRKTLLVSLLALSVALGAAGAALEFGGAEGPAHVVVPQHPAERGPLQFVEQTLFQIDQTLGGFAAAQSQQELRMSSLELELAKLAAAPGPQPEPEALPVPKLERDPEELARERFEQLRQRVDVEPRDESWRSGAERHVADQFQREDLKGSRLVGIDCRSTLCVANVQHDDEASREDFLGTFPNSLGWNFDAQMQLHAQKGVLSTTLVMTRDGVTLPLD